MRELLSGRRHVARVRYAAYALALIGVWAGAFSDSDHGAMEWTVAALAALRLSVSFSRKKRNRFVRSSAIHCNSGGSMADLRRQQPKSAVFPPR